MNGRFAILCADWDAAFGRNWPRCWPGQPAVTSEALQYRAIALIHPSEQP